MKNTPKSRKQLEILLSKLEGFKIPKINLEQYETDPSLAAEILWTAYMHSDIYNKAIADLGAGTGILGIGALLLGAKKAYFVEVDKDAIDILKKNLELIREYVSMDENVVILNMDITKFEENVDTVLMNPPFGVQSKFIVFENFINKACKISKVIYLIFDKAKKDKVLDIISKNGFEVDIVKEGRLLLKRKYWFHEKDIYYLDIFWVRAKRRILD